MIPYMYVCVCIYIYIYIYICVCVCVCVWNTKEPKTIYLLGVNIAVALGGGWLMDGMEHKTCAAFFYGCWLPLSVQFLKFQSSINL